MKLLKRILGICETLPPSDPGSIQVSGRTVRLELSKLPELGTPGAGVRFEGGGLPERLLVMRLADGGFFACQNRCTHIGGRRLDPDPAGGGLRCCSVMGSRFDFSGRPVTGPAKRPIRMYPVSESDGMLEIDLDG